MGGRFSRQPALMQFRLVDFAIFSPVHGPPRSNLVFFQGVPSRGAEERRGKDPAITITLQGIAWPPEADWSASREELGERRRGREALGHRLSMPVAVAFWGVDAHEADTNDHARSGFHVDGIAVDDMRYAQGCGLYGTSRKSDE